MTDQLLDVPSAQLAYSTIGSGDRVVVAAHGLTSSRGAEEAWGVFDWSAVATGARLVRYDARGHGASTGRPEQADYVWSALAEDLLALIDTVSPDAPVDAIGASMGTATIIWAAIRRPDRFRRLVLSIPPTAWETRAAQAGTYLAGADFVESSGPGAVARLAATMQPAPLLVEGGWLDLPAPAVAQELLPAVFRGAASSDLPDPAEIRTIPHPALLLPWTTDPGHPVSTAERLAELLPDAVLEIADEPDEVRGWGQRAAAFLAD
ncbi:alpha/beta fold hydrolase [Amnibacterium flavum]|uniref:Alpha/beta hydrolase n=1 Tax=Amnibacterium flavum TaxID=2173173 RepID=A0A2V1HUJ5_9MICO|nr:alpha/beta hydrolase [Amnibacterium flavum]PVZ94630.1 alpha/beta hydrolase [Amnibacterium flavum]